MAFAKELMFTRVEEARKACVLTHGVGALISSGKPQTVDVRRAKITSDESMIAHSDHAILCTLFNPAKPIKHGGSLAGL